MDKNISLVIGIDEAGRGPLIGDMVIGFVIIDENNLEKLKNLGVRDSKLLTPEERSNLIKDIIKLSKLSIVSYVSPLQIDHENLNKILLDRIYDVLLSIKSLLNNWTVKRITIDMIRGYEKYIVRLRDIFPNTKILFKEKAERSFIEVAAASILAKYYRDTNIHGLKPLFGDYGSGYPTDNKVRQWIKRLYSRTKEPPPIVRRTWGMLKEIAPEWYVEKKALISRKKKRAIKSILDFIGKK